MADATNNMDSPAYRHGHAEFRRLERAWPTTRRIRGVGVVISLVLNYFVHVLEAGSKVISQSNRRLLLLMPNPEREGGKKLADLCPSV